MNTQTRIKKAIETLWLLPVFFLRLFNREPEKPYFHESREVVGTVKGSDDRVRISMIRTLYAGQFFNIGSSHYTVDLLYFVPVNSTNHNAVAFKRTWVEAKRFPTYGECVRYVDEIRLQTKTRGGSQSHASA